MHIIDKYLHLIKYSSVTSICTSGTTATLYSTNDTYSIITVAEQICRLDGYNVLLKSVIGKVYRLLHAFQVLSLCTTLILTHF